MRQFLQEDDAFLPVSLIRFQKIFEYYDHRIELFISKIRISITGEKNTDHKDLYCTEKLCETEVEWSTFNRKFRAHKKSENNLQ